jgi:NTE family protein
MPRGRQGPGVGPFFERDGGIEAEDITRGLSASSKMNFDWKFLTHLFAMGRARAEKWLADNFELLGVKTTFDLHSKYL